jgi:hypothetical protein
MRVVDWPQSRATLLQSDSEAVMRRQALVYCEVCGGTTASGAADFVVFHCLAFCSPDCRDDYRVADEECRAARETANAAHARAPKRSRAA